MDFAEAYNMAATDITREIYFNIGGPQGFMRWGIYIFFFLALGYFFYSLRKRIKIWKAGKPQIRKDRPLKRLWVVIQNVFFQSKILKERYAGLMHAGFFFGFLVLFIVTVIILVQEDVTALFFDYHFINGNFYLIWSLFADVFGAVVFLGLLMAMIRRYIIKPTRLDTKATDTFFLLLILFIIITGFLNEALRIAMTGFPPFEVWSPVGYVLAMPFKGISYTALGRTHAISWWLHMLAAFVFIALLAKNKLGHIIISSLNVFFSDLNNRDPRTKYMHPIIDPQEFEEAESFGVGKVEDFTWKQLLDGDACTRCGRCQDNCPAWLTDKPLSPKKIITDVKDNMDERVPKLLSGTSGENVQSTALIDGSVSPDEIWSCTNCAACMVTCPVEIEHVPKINDMRRYNVLMEAKMSGELQTTFTNMENNFNPYGFAFATRGEWVPDDLGVKTLSEDTEVDYLYFVGCAASFDKRNQEVAAAFLNIMKKAGIKVGILGSEESCCGDSAMRGGNEYLFQMLAAANLEKFAQYNVKKIITTCPHGYNILKKEYKLFADKGVDSQGKKLQYGFEVFHHSEIINELLKNGTITLPNKIQKSVTYHDSCFLGRYNNMYKQPREVIRAVNSAGVKEMKRHHDTSFCCGAGGARMFMDETIGTRVNHDRTIQAEMTGAEIVCTACPFCMTMLSDGIGDLEIDTMQAMDIAELVYKVFKDQ